MIFRIGMVLFLFSAGLQGADVVPTTLPAGLGVNIHFTDPRPGEMKMLAGAGFKFVRMDFSWSHTEKRKGVYDFESYERLLKSLDEHQIRALLILDYANPLYDEGKSPCTDEGRKAFAKWAAAAAKRFAGRGILWEMYNEPNISPFWKPVPKADDYIKLALEVGKALREAAPDEILIGPASSRIDLPFLETCFKAGLLEYFAAVSVHPYRQQVPETVMDEYRKLRRLIAQYAPSGKQVPIFSGEWGYSSVWGGFDDQKQALFLPQQWLSNLACDVPLSIWYDWHDDGPDPAEGEHHFGTVAHEYLEGKDPVYTPKPAYQSAKALTTLLGGYRFNKRLDNGFRAPGGEDFVLLFDKGEEVRIAAWTTIPRLHDVTIPASPGTFIAYDHLGAEKGKLESGDTGLTLSLTDAPQYIVADKPNDLLRVAAAWERAPAEIITKSSQIKRISTKFRNPLGQRVRISSASAGPSATQWVNPGDEVTIPVRVGLLRDPAPVEVPLFLKINEEHEFRQMLAFVVTDGLEVTVWPPAMGKLPLKVDNPSGDAFAGSIQITLFTSDGRQKVKEISQELRLAQGETSRLITIPIPEALPLTIEVVERADRRFTIVSGARYVPLSPSAGEYQVVAEGDNAVKSSQSIADEPSPPDLPPGPISGVMKLSYGFDAGWKYVCIKPKDQTTRLRRVPNALGLWIRGDGSSNIPRVRMVDSTDQTFQTDGTPLSDQKWRYLEFSLSEPTAHWGGANDGVAQEPVRLDTLFLLDSAHKQKAAGTVYFANPTLIYSD